MQTTISELATTLGVDYAAAAGLIKVMLKQDKATPMGKKVPASGKGVGASIYEVEE